MTGSNGAGDRQDGSVRDSAASAVGGTPILGHPAMALSSSRARMLGQYSQRRRWARVVDPVERAAHTAAARAALDRKYAEAALAMPGGDRLTADQLVERAHQLRLAVLAKMRIHSHAAREAKAAAKALALSMPAASHQPGGPENQVASGVRVSLAGTAPK